jgi:hypothetical protein
VKIVQKLVLLLLVGLTSLLFNLKCVLKQCANHA